MSSLHLRGAAALTLVLSTYGPGVLAQPVPPEEPSAPEEPVSSEPPPNAELSPPENPPENTVGTDQEVPTEPQPRAPSAEEVELEQEAKAAHVSAIVPEEATHSPEKETPKWTIEAGGAIQARFSTESSKRRWWNESDDLTDDEAEGADDSTAFSIPRVLLRVGGRAYQPELSYKVQVDVEQGVFLLQDAFVNYAFAPQFQLRVGKDRRPFSRQFITDDTQLQFSERAQGDQIFGNSRDIGVLLHNGYMSNQGFEYAVGLYQGAYDRRYDVMSYNDDTGKLFVEEAQVSADATEIEPTLVLRIGYNTFGAEPEKNRGIDQRGGAYRESDLTGGGFRYGVNFSFLADVNANRTGDARARFGVDSILKAGGWSLSTALAFAANQVGEDFIADREVSEGSFFLQSGYVFARLLEPAVRLEAFAWQGDDKIRTLASITGGLNVFLHGHDFKWVNELSLTKHDIDEYDDIGVSTNTTLFRSQLQLAF